MSHSTALVHSVWLIQSSIFLGKIFKSQTSYSWKIFIVTSLEVAYCYWKYVKSVTVLGWNYVWKWSQCRFSSLYLWFPFMRWSNLLTIVHLTPINSLSIFQDEEFCLPFWRKDFIIKRSLVATIFFVRMSKNLRIF